MIGEALSLVDLPSTTMFVPPRRVGGLLAAAGLVGVPTSPLAGKRLLAAGRLQGVPCGARVVVSIDELERFATSVKALADQARE